SYYNALELCQGTVAEMPNSDVYDAIARFTGTSSGAYAHVRNVVGKARDYKELFIDEGDVDMLRALEVYAQHGYGGLFLPDHTPQMTCAAPWHAGMAYALAYLRASMRALGIPIT